MQARFRLAFTTTVLAIAPQADTWAATGSSNPALGIADLEDDGPRELEAFLPPLERDPFTRSLPSTTTLSSSTIRIIGQQRKYLLHVPDAIRRVRQRDNNWLGQMGARFSGEVPSAASRKISSLR